MAAWARAFSALVTGGADAAAATPRAQKIHQKRDVWSMKFY
jgi:hypothetical protein